MLQHHTNTRILLSSRSGFLPPQRRVHIHHMGHDNARDTLCLRRAARSAGLMRPFIDELAGWRTFDGWTVGMMMVSLSVSVSRTRPNYLEFLCHCAVDLAHAKRPSQRMLSVCVCVVNQPQRAHSVVPNLAAKCGGLGHAFGSSCPSRG